MVSIGKLSAGQEGYYLEQAAERVDAAASIGGGAEDYYLDPSEAGGEGLGGGSSRLGLRGAVGPEQLRRVLAGEHPVEPLLLRRPTARSRVAAYDLTFSAPKSVSVLFGLGEGQVVEQVRAAHEVAVREA